MILGVWRSHGHALLPAIPSGVGEHVLMGEGWLWASPPGRIEHRPGAAVAHQQQPAVGGEVRLTPSELAVDAGRFPQYPLYYSTPPDHSFFAVCSQVAPLLGMVSSPPVEARRLVELIAWLPDPQSGGTAYAGIRRMRGGESILVSEAGVRATRSLPKAGQQYLRATPTELAEELRSQLLAAVVRAVGEARRVAVFVGGGLDSSGVLGLALARYRGAPVVELQALAEVWASPGDDRPHLAALEQAWGIEAVRLPASRAAPWFAPSLCLDAQPQSFPAACLELFLWSAAAARGVDVSLGGYGGDEVCGGDVSFASLVARGHPIEAVARALRLEMPWPVSPMHRLAHWVAKPLVRPILPQRLHRSLQRRRHTSWMTRMFRDTLDELLALTPTRSPNTPDERLAQLCQLPYFAELSTSWGQMASEVGSGPIDVFRDSEFVRFVAQIDPVTLSHGHTFRGLYRLAMKGVIPESVRTRPDKAFGQPAIAAAAMAADAVPLLRELSSLEQLRSLGLVDPTPLRPLFDAWIKAIFRGERLEPDPTDESWHVIWQLVSVEAFLRRHGSAGAAKA